MSIALSNYSYGQSPALTYKEYMKNVKENNIDYVIKKYDVNISEANLEASKVFPNPEISLSYSNNQDKTLKMGQSYEGGLEYSLELGGKRKARIGVAKLETEITKILLEDYFRNLQADATLSYLNALKEKELFNLSKSSQQKMTMLSHSDSIRFSLGQITKVDAIQSKFEANKTFNDVVQSEYDFKNSLTNILVFQGNKLFNEIDSISGGLIFIRKDFNIIDLINTALNNRSDLKAILKSKDLSDKNLKLIRANRFIDLGLSLNISHNQVVKNETAPAPAFSTISAGISIPLKFSNLNKGELLSAEYSIKQSQANIETIEMQIRKEVTQAYNNYTSTCNQVEQYNKTLLLDADTILKSKTYSYQRGETSLLEVLNAQRTYNEVYQNYYEALFNCLSSLVELERSCNIWDIEL
jgi:cobalt-zinc-cadmium efflux system outer membrane protein